MRSRGLTWLLCLLAVTAAGLYAAGEHAIPAGSPHLQSLPLYGKIVGVDAGHGGYDGGCVSVTGVAEKEYNLSVALLVGKELQALAARWCIRERRTSL